MVEIHYKHFPSTLSKKRREFPQYGIANKIRAFPLQFVEHMKYQKGKLMRPFRIISSLKANFRAKIKKSKTKSDLDSFIKLTVGGGTASDLGYKK